MGEIIGNDNEYLTNDEEEKNTSIDFVLFEKQGRLENIMTMTPDSITMEHIQEFKELLEQARIYKSRRRTLEKAYQFYNKLQNHMEQKYKTKPRSKFRFTRNTQNHQNVMAIAQQNTINENKVNNDNLSQSSRSYFNPEHNTCMIKNRSGETFVIDEKMLQGFKDVTIENVSQCIIIIEQSLGALRATNLDQVILLTTSPIESSFLLYNCTKSLFWLHTHQMRIHNTHTSCFLCDSRCSPVIENSTNLIFGNLKPLLGTHYSSQPFSVVDFNWHHQDETSPHWQELDNAHLCCLTKNLQFIEQFNSNNNSSDNNANDDVITYMKIQNVEDITLYQKELQVHILECVNVMASLQSAEDAFRLMDAMLDAEPVEITYSRLAEDLQISPKIAQRLLASYVDSRATSRILQCTFVIGYRALQESSARGICFTSVRGTKETIRSPLLDIKKTHHIDSITITSISTQSKSQDSVTQWQEDVKFALTHYGSITKDELTDKLDEDVNNGKGLPQMWIPFYVCCCLDKNREVPRRLALLPPCTQTIEADVATTNKLTSKKEISSAPEKIMNCCVKSTSTSVKLTTKQLSTVSAKKSSPFGSHLHELPNTTQINSAFTNSTNSKFPRTSVKKGPSITNKENVDPLLSTASDGDIVTRKFGFQEEEEEQEKKNDKQDASSAQTPLMLSKENAFLSSTESIGTEVTTLTNVNEMENAMPHKRKRRRITDSDGDEEAVPSKKGVLSEKNVCNEVMSNALPSIINNSSKNIQSGEDFSLFAYDDDAIGESSEFRAAQETDASYEPACTSNKERLMYLKDENNKKNGHKKEILKEKNSFFSSETTNTDQDTEITKPVVTKIKVKTEKLSKQGKYWVMDSVDEMKEVVSAPRHSTSASSVSQTNKESAVSPSTGGGIKRSGKTNAAATSHQQQASLFSFFSKK